MDREVKGVVNVGKLFMSSRYKGDVSLQYRAEKGQSDFHPATLQFMCLLPKALKPILGVERGAYPLISPSGLGLVDLLHTIPQLILIHGPVIQRFLGLRLAFPTATKLVFKQPVSLSSSSLCAISRLRHFAAVTSSYAEVHGVIMLAMIPITFALVCRS